VTARAERQGLGLAAVALLAALGLAPAARAATPFARAATPFVRVEAKLERPSQKATRIVALIRWNADGIDSGMTAGDLRAVAVSTHTVAPTLLAKSFTALSSGGAAEPRRVVFTITGRDKLAALRRGNRVVLTATQHGPVGDPPVPASSRRSYVTVAQLQRGPKRGRVGSADCSDRPVGPEAGAGALRYCDLVGASLAGADLSSTDMHMADLTGAGLRSAGLASAILDGGRLAGVDASGAVIRDTSMVAILAPKLTIRATKVGKDNLYGASLNGSDFSHSTFEDAAFTAAELDGRTSFADTTLIHVDLAFARLVGSDFRRAELERTSLFFANLTGATLLGATLTEPEEGGDPLVWAEVCRTTLPDGSVSKRDCRLLARDHPSAATARAKRPPEDCAATAIASSMRSTSRSSGSSVTRRPSSASRARWARQVPGSLMGTPMNACGRGSRIPTAQ
jgi:uncharacterized protein YjbI with pentapeptide repeats